MRGRRSAAYGRDRTPGLQPGRWQPVNAALLFAAIAAAEQKVPRRDRFARDDRIYRALQRWAMREGPMLRITIAQLAVAAGYPNRAGKLSSREARISTKHSWTSTVHRALRSLEHAGAIRYSSSQRENGQDRCLIVQLLELEPGRVHKIARPPAGHRTAVRTRRHRRRRVRALRRGASPAKAPATSRVIARIRRQSGTPLTQGAPGPTGLGGAPPGTTRIDALERRQGPAPPGPRSEGPRKSSFGGTDEMPVIVRAGDGPLNRSLLLSYGWLELQHEPSGDPVAELPLTGLHPDFTGALLEPLDGQRAGATLELLDRARQWTYVPPAVAELAGELYALALRYPDARWSVT